MKTSRPRNGKTSRTNRLILAGMGAVQLASAGLRAEAPIPAHPEKIAYPPLTFQLPEASQFRTTLSNGVVVYIAEDRLLPTFDLSITLRTGSAVEPPAQAGLASLTGEQIRDGGTKNLTPAVLDDQVEFLAASMSVNIGKTRGRAALSCLSKDIDEALSLLMEMLRYPRFDAQRLRQAKERTLQNIQRRNDSTASIMNIEWGFLINGPNHFSNVRPTTASIQSIARDDLVAFHRQYIHPGNMIVAVSGDFERDPMLQKLEKAFGDWPVGETGPTTFPAPDYTPAPGVYAIHKKGVNQGRVAIGHLGAMRGTLDEFALEIMNGILGASGFRSRLVAKVRSDEGLAYNTGSRFQLGVYYPGEFQCWFQSRSNACAYATRIVLEEIQRLRDERVTREDVEATVAYFVESFPQRFQNKMAILETYVSDEYTGRDPAYWQTYIDNLKRVLPGDVQRVARQYLDPEQLVILAVGDTEEIIGGGHDKAPELRFDAFGEIKRLPLRDPETLKR